MAEVKKNNEELVLNDTIKVNNKGEAILGVLEGPCADVINPTRNERQYDEELWERVFKDEIINEYFNCGGILGELDHPTDRTETDTSKVAICMPEKPKKGKDGKLYARFDILDTPNGRIAYTLAKYGYKLGVSSRGDGDVYEAFDGKEHVDPKTYSLKAFDLVILPAVKAARLTLKESVGNKTLKQALNESLRSATKDEKAIMIESLERLKIDYKTKRQSSSNSKKESVITESVNTSNKGSEAVDNGSVMMKEVQRLIKENKELKESLASVQEQLSVCHAKESKYEETISKLNESATTKKDDNSSLILLKNKVKSLTEDVNAKDEIIKKQRIKLIKLTENAKVNSDNKQSLNEQLTQKSRESQLKDRKIKSLQESLNEAKAKSESIEKSLTESINEMKKDRQIKAKEYSDKIAKANRIVEHYKKVANGAMDKYIESKAKMLGLTVSDIKSKLNESYTFGDVDKLCESLQGYKVAMNKLPIELRGGSKKVKVTESKEPIRLNKGIDDTVDESLLRLIDIL